MKINNSLDVAQWEKLDKNSDEYKKCKTAWNSVPQKDFKTTDNIVEYNEKTKKHKLIKKQTKTVSEITLVRGTNDKVLGWSF
jgi:hypothetical protein|tara:strand:- start:733 stop:978 length:246 start_codon:yes stop_codon:yes gene_type:complete